MISIQHVVDNNESLVQVKLLFVQYLQELNEDLCFQNWDKEIENPLLKYGPPKGSLIIAYYNNQPAGCIAIQDLENGVCEMKRMFVLPQLRKHGIGKLLVEAILQQAMLLGYKKMVLDTLTRLTSAIRLYEKYGFIHTTAYYANPLPNVVYMEKELLQKG